MFSLLPESVDLFLQARHASPVLFEVHDGDVNSSLEQGSDSQRQGDRTEYVIPW